MVSHVTWTAIILIKQGVDGYYKASSILVSSFCWPFSPVCVPLAAAVFAPAPQEELLSARLLAADGQILHLRQVSLKRERENLQEQFYFVLACCVYWAKVATVGQARKRRSTGCERAGKVFDLDLWFTDLLSFFSRF